jgi:hypothetical protein
MQVYPNPNDGDFIVKFNLKKTEPLTITIFNSKGELLDKSILKTPELGENTFSKRIKKLTNGGVFFITIETSYEKSSQKIIVQP